MQALNKNLSKLLENHQAGARRLDTAVLEGSTRSGKTWSALEYLVVCCYNMPGVIATVFRRDERTHIKAAMRDFLSLMGGRYAPLWRGGHWNGLLKTFTFANGSVIEFAGSSDTLKLQGPERDFALLNEGMEISYEAYMQIAARTRCMLIIDFNPSLNHHWIFERVLRRPDVLYVHSTYRDNPHLADKIVRHIESTDPGRPENVRNGTADEWYWKVYGLGERAPLEGVIYTNYRVAEQWPERLAFSVWGYGLDFGSVDPTALVEVGLHQDKLWVRKTVYESGLIVARSREQPNLPSLQGRMEEAGVEKVSPIIADCARPEAIRALAAEGYNVWPCRKWKGSVNDGINLVKRFPMMIHRDSTDILTELEAYRRKRHAEGYFMEEPEDRHNHALDAVRYFAQEKLAHLSFDPPGTGRGRGAKETRRRWDPLRRRR